jgi:hypothetical protein
MPRELTTGPHGLAGTARPGHLVAAAADGEAFPSRTVPE